MGPEATFAQNSTCIGSVVACIPPPRLHAVIIASIDGADVLTPSGTSQSQCLLGYEMTEGGGFSHRYLPYFPEFKDNEYHEWIAVASI